MGKLARVHRDLEVYRQVFDCAMTQFELTRRFPVDERYSLTDQVRRSSRSVTAAIAEAWRKRRYPAAFVAKLNDAEAEAAETQTWIEYAVRCRYLTREHGAALYRAYEQVLKTLVRMIRHADTWVLATGVDQRG